MNIIDTPWNVTSKLACLSSQGIKTVIRYYNFSNSRGLPEKRLELAEAEHIAGTGLNIAIVFQQKQSSVSDFTAEKGLAAGKRAYSYARDHIGQPSGSGIYFGVDFDVDSREIQSSIIPYFDGVKEGFLAESRGGPAYRVGAYGSGLVCAALEEKKYTELTWLSMSRGFRGTREAYENGRYHICQKAPAANLCGLGVDFNEMNPDVDNFGEFKLDSEEVDANIPVPTRGTRYKVVARRGLRLREGPGQQFDIIDGLPSGQLVYVSSISDGWASIDVEGDGQMDGFASAAFLEPA